VGRISIDLAALRGEAARLDGYALELLRALHAAEHALDRPGLPGYARQSRQAIGQMKRTVAMVQLGAETLRARYALACLADAPGGALLRLRIEAFEKRKPGELLKMLMEASISVGLPEATRWTAGVVVNVAEQYLKTRLALTDRQWRTMRREMQTMSEDAFKGLWGRSKADMSRALGPLWVAKGAHELPFPKRPARFGIGPGMLVDAILQWGNDRGERMGAGTRVARVGVNVGAGVAGGALAAAACAGTAGLGCPLAVGLFSGFMANAVAGDVNATLFPTEKEQAEAARRERLLRMARELRKTDQWYMDNANPSKAWYDERLKGATTTRQVSQFGTTTTYTLPGASQPAARRVDLPDGGVELYYYDESGKPVKTVKTP
jgi:hypothetical protein